MPQMQLPLVPDGSTEVNNSVYVYQQNETWYYFFWNKPVFSHAENDQKSFRMITASLVALGTCKQFQSGATAIYEACLDVPMDVRLSEK